MKPIIKWTGGKRREIKCFEKYLLKDFDLYIEPFFGGGAVFWHIQPNVSIINDYDKDLINFYKNIVKPSVYKDIFSLTRMEKREDLEQLYYEFRDNIQETDEERAVAFAFINQLAFSGMRRFNSKGKFNVPFGHYKKFSINLTKQHIGMLKTADIKNEDGIKLIENNDKDGIFIFLDPPYTRIFKKYSSDNVFGEEEHRRLSKVLKNIKNSKFLLVIDKSELTKELYDGLIKDEYDIQYGVNIKNRFDNTAKHLIIANYSIF